MTHTLPTEDQIIADWKQSAGFINAEKALDPNPLFDYTYTTQSYGYSVVSDFFKSLNGFRPRWMSDFSETELAREYASLCRQAIIKHQEDEVEILNEKRLAFRYGVDVPTLAEWGVIPACTDWRYGCKWYNLMERLELDERNGYFTPAPPYPYEEYDCLFA